MKEQKTVMELMDRYIGLRNHKKQVIAWDDFKWDMPIWCSLCGWSGTPNSSGTVNTDSHDLLSVDCPVCEAMVLIAEYPLIN